jgi:hypothetical protein
MYILGVVQDIAITHLDLVVLDLIERWIEPGGEDQRVHILLDRSVTD